MANRPVYRVCSKAPFVTVEDVEFTWYPGFATIQRQRCIRSLHENFLAKRPGEKVLEVSSDSEDDIGIKLSAFNLEKKLEDGKAATVECVYQGGKVFTDGGPYTDLLLVTSSEAKHDSRVKTKDERRNKIREIVGFEFEGKSFPSNPATFFYNWVYAKAVSENPDLAGEIMKYTAFTDIEFNPRNGTNCQAMAAAVFVSLKAAGLLEQALASPEDYLRIVYGGVSDGSVKPDGKAAGKSSASTVKQACMASVKASSEDESGKAEASSEKVDEKAEHSEALAVTEPPEIPDLTGQKLVHRKFGEGIVRDFDAENRRLLVAFSSGEKKLKFEKVFPNFAHLEDYALNEKVREIVTNYKFD